MVHKTTVEIIHKESRMFLPVCICGWSGFMTTARRLSSTSDGVLSGGRIAATAQLRKHLLSPVIIEALSPLLQKAA